MTDTARTSNSAAKDRDNPSEKPNPRVGRRKMILGVAAAGVGASVLAGADPVGAESSDVATKDVVLSKANKAKATTSISMSVDGNCGVEGIDISSGGGYGVAGVSTGGYGIHGVSTDGVGVYGETQADGQGGVEGIDISSGGGYGVSGTSNSGKGVYGQSTDSDGLHGQTSGTGACGVYGYDGSTDGGYGVNGQSENGYGVYGTSNNGTGVYGSSAANGSGVYGLATSENGIGVQGISTEGSYGVYGEGGVGVYGNSPEDYGLGASGISDGVEGQGVGAAVSGEDGYGVYTFASQSATTALYADGNAVVTGSLSNGGASFKIDHPLDPGGKYLYHSFVESPDMMNVYNGTVTLDGEGQATVELPDWFEALNRDYRYQLTALDAAAPDLHISSRVANGEFSIAGGKSGQEVSWQVTGIRQDAWANANRIPVEVDKKAEDQGRYLHPGLFGGEVITRLARARERTRRGQHTTPA
jgi:hypothetical protein